MLAQPLYATLEFSKIKCSLNDYEDKHEVWNNNNCKVYRKKKYLKKYGHITKIKEYKLQKNECIILIIKI